MTLRRILSCLLLLLPWLAQAGDGADFAAASRTQQATLLQQWAAAPQASRLPLLQALRNESVVIDQNKQPFSKQADQFLPLDSARQPDGETKKLFMNNRLRVLIASALAAHQLVSDDAATRLRAAQQLQNDAAPDQLPLIEQRLAAEQDSKVHAVLAMAAANLQLASPDAALRLKAVTLLGESGDPAMQASLTRLTQASNEPDAQVRAAAAASLQHIKQRLMWGDWLGQAFTGLSLGSILLLAALGLAITYGLLGVINMAHGEMLMLGAYATWLVQNLFQQFAPQWLAWYPLLALPVAFAVTAVMGMLLERTIIRHLYGCGVPTGRIDMLAFGLGSGIAGLGGVALSQLGNVGPELGQGYIIDSFLVVVLGGVGQLAGTVVAAFGLGLLNKVLEPQIGAVLGKILILVLIVLFIQKRPQGLFAVKGRVID